VPNAEDVKDHVVAHGKWYGIAATLLGLLIDALLKARSDNTAHQRSDAEMSLEASVAEVQMVQQAQIDSLKLRVGKVERKKGVRTVIVVDTLAVKKRGKESHGFWWHFTHIDGKEH
jgi:hypothetical protein